MRLNYTVLRLVMNNPAWIDQHPILFGVGLGLSLWVGVSFLLSFIGGWALLRGRFRYSGTFKGKRWSSQSGQMRFIAGYRNCLILGASEEGLYMSTILPFRIGHPPLLIPWSQITVDSKNEYIGVRFKLGQYPWVSLWLQEPLADRIKQAAGASWPGPL